MRYLSSASGFKKEDVPANKDAVWNGWKDIRKNIKIVDSIGQDMSWVEAVCRTYTPDIVVIDIGDKFATQAGFARPDEALKANAIHAREIAKRHNCAVFYMSQLSAEAEGRIQLNQSMMEGSKTGKASEADLMLLLAKNPSEGVTEGEQEGEDGIRHIILAKNKLSGWHGRVTCEFDYETGRFGA
jgi:RecA-family ATPase